MLLPLDEHDEHELDDERESGERESGERDSERDNEKQESADLLALRQGQQQDQHTGSEEAGRGTVDMSADSFERLGYEIWPRGKPFDGSQSIDFEESSFETASYRLGFCSLPNTPLMKSPRLDIGTNSLPNTPLMRSPRIHCPGSSGRRISAFNLEERSALLVPATGWEISKRQNRAEASGASQRTRTPIDFSPPSFEQQLIASRHSPSGASPDRRQIWAITQPRRSPGAASTGLSRGFEPAREASGRAAARLKPAS